MAQIVPKSFSESDDVFTTVEASFNLFQLVITGEAVDKTSDEVGDSFDGDTVGSLPLRVVRSDGADRDGSEVSGGKTGFPHLFSVFVSLDLFDVAVDVFLVESDILSDGFGEFGWFSEDLSPVRNSFKIVAHMLASMKSGGKLERDNAELQNSLDKTVGRVLVELVKSVGNFFVDHVATVVASFDLEEVVLTGHAVHEAADEFGDV